MKRDDTGVPPSLDDQIKAAQRDKLQAEVKQLKGISLETLGKLGVTALGILAAAFTLWAGVPQTRLDLARAQEDLYTKRQELAQRTAEVTRKALEVQQKQAELADTELRRASTANELARLQNEIMALGKNLESRRAASGKPLESNVEQRIVQVIKPRVFVQFAGEMNRASVIDPLREELTNSGLIVPAAERINKGQKNEVRYFSKDQRILAQNVTDETKAYFKRKGCPLPSLSTTYVSLPQNRQSPVELWLKHNCPIN
ncbi:hypothetical protein CJP72_21495 [Citrobacter sp. NCU1]|uniref:hypothetical protein n=1 Tax=Citrobacter sp. NCU1 TaxID=2026683 RepID=UPI00139082B1|nr:hypothetical protein [Citrobacter sp. NCU1]NDO83245.1 hypothetical protein [Citrobacter sp. NCU1]